MIEFKWDHLQLASTDAEATAAWFARCLSAEIVRRPGRVDLRLGDINLFITRLAQAESGAPATPAAPPAPAAAREGIDHFGVRVDDLDAAYAHLLAEGAEIVEPIKQIRAGVRGCFVKAPGQIVVEILERRPAEMTFN
ncbi:MAG: VOC family protein [Burkholderia sp.]